MARDRVKNKVTNNVKVGLSGHLEVLLLLNLVFSRTFRLCLSRLVSHTQVPQIRLSIIGIGAM